MTVQTQGSLREGGLASLLQTMQSERATGTLVLEKDGENCSLYFLFGHLFHANGSGGQGEDAVVTALGWQDGEYHFDPRAKLPAEETIKSSPADLIAAAESRQPAAAGAGTSATTTSVEEPSWQPSDFSVIDTIAPREAASTSAADLTYTPPAPSPLESPGLATEAPAASAGGWTPAAEEAPAPATEPLTYPTEPEPEPAYVPPAPVTPAPSPAPSSAAGATSRVLGTAEASSDEVMYPLPAGRAHYEGLKSAFVDFPRLLRTLRSDRHTGYVRLSGSGYLAVILLHDGQALEAVSRNAMVSRGESAFQQIRRHMDSGDGVLDVIELDRDTVLAVARLFSAPPLYTGLLGRFVNLDALLEYLGEEKLDGSVLVTGSSETGVILLGEGTILGAYTESQRALDRSTTAVAALATERTSRIEVKGGSGSVAPLDVDSALSRPY